MEKEGVGKCKELNLVSCVKGINLPNNIRNPNT